MEHSYWSNWSAGWGWFLWIGVWVLLLSSFGNWGYTYRVHRRYGDLSQRTSLDILNERYARGDINREEFLKIKNDILPPHNNSSGDQIRRNPTTA